METINFEKLQQRLRELDESISFIAEATYFRPIHPYELRALKFEYKCLLNDIAGYINILKNGESP